MQDRSVAHNKKVQVQMVQTEDAVAIKNGIGGQQRFDRLLESANKHALDIIPQAIDRIVWCTVTVESDLVMVHFNYKDLGKAYAYLYAYDEFYTEEDGQYKGYNLINHCLMDYDEKHIMVSSRSLIDD